MIPQASLYWLINNVKSTLHLYDRNKTHIMLYCFNFLCRKQQPSTVEKVDVLQLATNIYRVKNEQNRGGQKTCSK